MTAVTTRAEARRSARNGAIGLVGAAVNGVCGFVLTAVVARTFGASGSGVLYSVIGLVSIAGAICCFGSDTGLMWAIPRRRPDEAGRLLPVALLPTVALSLLVCAAGWAAAAPVGDALLGDLPSATSLIRLAFAGIPIIVVATVLLAAVRATRHIAAYVGVQMLFVPITRPLLMIAVAATGGGVLLGFGAWLLPMAAAVVLALALVYPSLVRGRQVRPAASDWRPFWSFAVPRAASVAIDASSMWVGVLLTGALASHAEGGVFAAAGRYAMAGLLVMQALRIAITPQLSRLLAAGRRAAAASVYRRTTQWIVVLSWPAYLVLAIFAPGFLRLFGDQFRGGAPVLTLLAVAMLVNVGVGIVQTVLLMSGNSRGHLAATAAGLALTVSVSVALIPAYGAFGAAIGWSLGIVCENVLAAVLARRALGESLFSAELVMSAGVVVSATGAAAALGVGVAGRGLAGLAITLGVLAVGALAALTSGRVRAMVAEFVQQFRPETRDSVEQTEVTS